MKGRFKLTRKYDHCTKELITLFGNLGTHDSEEYALFYNDDFSDYTGKLIAHDVIEHSTNHRRNLYVTVEEEIRALGAAAFIQPESDSLRGIISPLLYLNREIKPVFKMGIYDTGLLDAKDIICSMQEEDRVISTENANKIIQHFNMGYQQAYINFDGNQNKAYNAFCFIAEMANITLEQESYELRAGGKIVINFDTDTELYTHRLMNPKEYY